MILFLSLSFSVCLFDNDGKIRHGKRKGDLLKGGVGFVRVKLDEEKLVRSIKLLKFKVRYFELIMIRLLLQISI